MEALTALVRQSAQDVEQAASTPRAAGGRMPIDTGFLRNSVVTTVDGSTPGPTGIGLSRDQRFASLGHPNTQAALSQAQVGNIIMLTWTAFYAAYVEHNTMFMRGAIEMWDAIVEENARAIASRRVADGRRQTGSDCARYGTPAEGRTGPGAPRNRRPPHRRQHQSASGRNAAPERFDGGLSRANATAVTHQTAFGRATTAATTSVGSLARTYDQATVRATAFGRATANAAQQTQAAARGHSPTPGRRRGAPVSK